ncbi:MAG: hypothetical protein HYX97_00175 [Chloroflexi bacterium]|nr:hypothetical protein [Chloroflexota bacterium]
MLLVIKLPPGLLGDALHRKLERNVSTIAEAHDTSFAHGLGLPAWGLYRPMEGFLEMTVFVEMGGDIQQEPVSHTTFFRSKEGAARAKESMLETLDYFRAKGVTFPDYDMDEVIVVRIDSEDRKAAAEATGRRRGGRRDAAEPGGKAT